MVRKKCENIYTRAVSMCFCLNVHDVYVYAIIFIQKNLIKYAGKTFEKTFMINIIESISYKLWKYGLKAELFYIENKARFLRKSKAANKNKSVREIPEEIEATPETR